MAGSTHAASVFFVQHMLIRAEGRLDRDGDMHATCQNCRFAGIPIQNRKHARFLSVYTVRSQQIALSYRDSTRIFGADILSVVETSALIE